MNFNSSNQRRPNYALSILYLGIQFMLLTSQMENSNLTEDGDKFDPGTARFGNFINYYSFNTAENRVRLLPNFMQYVSKNCSNIICLDIGCNTGELTQALHKYIITKLGVGAPKCHILGLDIDEILIERANENNQNEFLTFKCVDALGPDFKTVYSEYMKQYGKPMFDIVFCFSITMWVHLNHGDEGLKRFIGSLGEIADMIVIEPQPWKCYTKAVRRMKRANSEPFTLFEKLKVRKEVETYIDNFLTGDCGFERVLQTAPTKWGRQISFYKRKT